MARTLARQSLALSRFRLSSVALAILFAVGGLFAVDRALSVAARSHVAQDALEAALVVEAVLASHAEVLQSIRGLYMDTTRSVNEADFRDLVSSLREYAPEFQGIWAIDSTGRVRHHYVLHGDGADTLQPDGAEHLAREARQASHMQLSGPRRLHGGQVGVLMVAPLFVRSQFVGSVVGSITSDGIVRAVERHRQQEQGQLVVLAGTDTVTRQGVAEQLGMFPHRRAAPVQTPGGQQWQVEVAHFATDQRERLLLWGIGLVTLAALLVAVVHERQQGVRLTERSSELERLSAELLRANRAKSEFLANVSHELRTPLNAIVGFVELLRDGVYGELAPRQVSPVDRIASSANHLRHLVDQVLDIAKMAAGRLEVHTEPVDLRSFVLNVASEVEALIGERGLNLSLAIPRTLPRVRTDPTHLRQILMNLLGNAVKYTPAGGIAVRARLVAAPAEVPNAPPPIRDPGGQPAPPVWIALQVADTGIGIAQVDRDRIFEEFEQVNAGPRGDSARRGTGLGLAISRRLARLLGGDLTVDSELGKGSTFTLWLGVTEADLAAVPPPVPTPPHSPAVPQLPTRS